jgi:hypothetical protein
MINYRTLVFFLILFLSLSLSGSAQEAATPLPKPAPEEHQELFGAHLQRSMALLSTSSKERRWPVRVLIYGQSITGSSVLTKMMDEILRARFPYADLTLENRSIGGFGADRLTRTSFHDLFPFYPDLLIFHVYGGEKTGDFERIIANTRRYTTADILIFNHHQNRDQKETLVFEAQHRRYLAQKYDCELVDVSIEWPRYLKENNYGPERLLRDNVHPNEDGNRLLTQLIGRHLIFNPIYPSPSWETVRRYDARRPLEEGVDDEIALTGSGWKLESNGVAGSSGSLKLKFEGNRIDLIAAQIKGLTQTGSARVLIDGKPPSADPRLYAITLPSKGPGTWFPSIRLVGHEKPLLLEDWTLRLTEVDQEAQTFRFEVSGSRTGPDGSGSSQERFVSNSGRVVIEPRDWMLVEIKKIFKQPALPPSGFEVRWSVKPMFQDVYTAPVMDDPSKVYAVTLAQGLTNTAHILEILPNGDGPVPIEAIQVYRPSLR